MVRYALALSAMLLALGPAAVWAGGWALGGMDAVAYAADGAAVPGAAGISTRWAGQEWHFQSVENRAAFEANPRAYAPGLKGLCPVSLAEGHATPGDPRFFAIVGQRLYLLQSAGARARFLEDPRGWLMKAKGNFVKLGR